MFYVNYHNGKEIECKEFDSYEEAKQFCFENHLIPEDCIAKIK